MRWARRVHTRLLAFSFWLKTPTRVPDHNFRCHERPRHEPPAPGPQSAEVALEGGADAVVRAGPQGARGEAPRGERTSSGAPGPARPSALEIRTEIRDLLTSKRNSEAHGKFVELLAAIRAIRDLQESLWGVVLRAATTARSTRSPIRADARGRGHQQGHLPLLQRHGQDLEPDSVNYPVASENRVITASSKAYRLMLWFEVGSREPGRYPPAHSRHGAAARGGVGSVASSSSQNAKEHSLCRNARAATPPTGASFSPASSAWSCARTCAQTRLRRIAVRRAHRDAAGSREVLADGPHFFLWAMLPRASARASRARYAVRSPTP